LFLLEDWLREVILPLYDRHQQLARESLSRKIGSLREAIATALSARLDRAREPTDGASDSGLRTAAGRMAEVREACMAITHDVRGQGGEAVLAAATRLTDAWRSGASDSPSVIVTEAIVQFAAERANQVLHALQELSQELAKALRSTGEAVRFAESYRGEDLASAIKEMPKLDLGPVEIELEPGLFLKISRNLSIRQTEKALERQIGERVSEVFSNYGSVLDAWARRTLSELQLRFETPAESYRAHLARIGARGEISASERSAIERDLSLLSIEA
jgi:hypothetical protein